MSHSLTSASDFNQSLLGFLQASPTPFHATQSMADILLAAGYTELFQHQTWQLQEQAGYFIRKIGRAQV